MPIASIPRDPLFAGLGKTFTEHEFEELCFEFGIELDEVVEEEQKGTKTRGVAEGQPVVETVYKIEVPANRYDVLCLEGMASALNVFLGNAKPPVYKMLTPPGGTPLQARAEQWQHAARTPPPSANAALQTLHCQRRRVPCR